jgi:hypothetical protein
MDSIPKRVIEKLQEDFFIDEESLQRYHHVFCKYDADGSGDIDTSELQMVNSDNHSQAYELEECVRLLCNLFITSDKMHLRKT